MENVYQYPWGPADVQMVAFAATMVAEIVNRETIINISGAMTAAATLNLDVNDKVPAGSVLTVNVLSDGTGRTLTLGAGMYGKAYAVTASKHACLTFKHDGTRFVNTGAILND